MSKNASFERPTKIFNSQFVVLLIVNFTTFFNFQMLQSNIVTYVRTMTSVQLLISMVPVMYSLVAMIMRPVSGFWIDRFDKKTLLFISQLGLTATCLAYLFTNTAALVILVRSLNGIFFGLNTTTSMAISSDVLPEDKMGSGLGIFGLSSILSMALGPTAGAFLVRFKGYNLMFLAAASATLLSSILMIFIRSKKPEAPAQKGISLSGMFAKEALLPSLITMCNSAAFAVISNYLLLYGSETGIENISLFFTIYSAALLVTRPIAGKLADTVDPKYIIYPTQVLIMGSMVLLGLAKGMGFVIAGGILFGVGYGGVTPILQTLALKSVPESRRGAASGTYYFAMDIANILIPLFCAAFYGVFSGYGPSFLIMAAAPIVGIAILFVYNRKQKREN